VAEFIFQETGGDQRFDDRSIEDDLAEREIGGDALAASGLVSSIGGASALGSGHQRSL
jgi:hypothetical protein